MQNRGTTAPEEAEIIEQQEWWQRFVEEVLEQTQVRITPPSTIEDVDRVKVVHRQYLESQVEVFRDVLRRMHT